jgi:hypothetical protein
VKLPRLTLRQWIGWTGFALVFLLTAAVAVWRGDILRAALDPQVPFQTYDPPPAPDYADAASWAMRDVRTPEAGPAAVFFLHSTTFDGGRDWNSPIGDDKADDYLQRVVIPNHAGPFARAGSVSVPRYRQASLYTRLTLRDDARDARAFAYGDALTAFDAWLSRHPTGPLVLAGLEQGGELLDRLVYERVLPDPDLRARVVAVYLMDVLSPVERFTDLPLCQAPDASGCAVIWAAAPDHDLANIRRKIRRGLTWNAQGQLVGIDGRPTACVNPVTGAVGTPVSAARQSRGATNSTNLEWGVHPPLVGRAVAAACRDGLLWYTRPGTESFRETGSWADRRKTPPYNLFFADIEADVLRRLQSWRERQP